MPKLHLQHRKHYKHFAFLLAGSLLLVSAAVLASPQLQETSNQAGSDALAAESTRPSSRDDADAIEKSAATTRSATPAIDQPVKKDAGQNMTNSGEKQTDRCDTRLARLQQGYTQEVTRKKADLDSRISFPMAGSNIITSYIEEYNEDVTKTYEQYVKTASDNGCPFPVRSPALLPPDYLPDGM